MAGAEYPGEWVLSSSVQPFIRYAVFGTQNMFFKAFTISIIFILSPIFVGARCVPSLPVPHANNAVAQLKMRGKDHIFSFAGLQKEKTSQDTSTSAFMFVEGEREWRKLPDLPVKPGRLAASAPDPCRNPQPVRVPTNI